MSTINPVIYWPSYYVAVAGFCEQYGFRVKLPVLLRVLIEQYGVISQAGADLSPAATLLI